MRAQISSRQLDALKETGTIGAGNAATSLSQMLDKRISISVPRAQVMDLQAIPPYLGGAESSVAAVYFQVSGAFAASFIVVFPWAEAQKLAGLLTGKSQAADALDEFSQSALQEMANISAGSYLTALSKVVKSRIDYSVPAMAMDMLQAVLDGVLSSLALQAEDAVVLDTDFQVEGQEVRGHYLFLPEPEGLRRLLRELGV